MPGLLWLRRRRPGGLALRFHALMQMAEYVPWIGPDWPDASRRLLLVGESHYVTDPRDDSDHRVASLLGSVPEASSG